MDGLGTLPLYLAPLRNTLKSLEMWSRSQTGDRRADFSSFDQLQTLRLPSAAYFQTYECHDRIAQQGFIWRVEDCKGIWSLLPPNIKTFDLQFRCPTMIFTRGPAYFCYFESLPDSTIIKGFDWILELLHTSVQEVLLTEYAYYCHPNCSMHLGCNARKLASPSLVQSQFDTAKVRLNISLLSTY
jgi:hypothetical protein